MHASIAGLLENAPVLLDGAMGTQLQARGLPIGACPDAWNLEEPGKVREVAAAYAEAGSQIVLTNTFGSTRIALARYGLADRAADVNRAGARLAVEGAAGRSLVFGSIGPSGAMLAMGDVSADDVLAAFREQADALAEGGAAGLVIETMSDLEEAALAVQAAKATGLPVAASMAYGSGKAGDRTMMGVTPEQAAAALSEAGADVVGANCGPDMATMICICERLKASTDRPIWMKPNAGQPHIVDGAAVSPMTVEEFVQGGLDLAAAGASFVGGCCGSTPDFLRALAGALEALRSGSGR